MPAPVIGTRPRYSPRYGAVVDRSHPLAQGLEFCFVPAVSEHVELARGYPATKSGTPARAATERGPASHTTGSTYWSFAGIPDAPFLGPITLLWVGVTTAAYQTFGMFAQKCNGTSGNYPIPFLLYRDSQAGSGPTHFVRGSATAQQMDRLPHPAGSPNVMHTYVITAPTSLSGARSAWVDGAKVTTQTQISGTGNPTGESATIQVGARAADGLASNAVTNIFAVWSREVSQGEAQALYADPFCFLRY